MDKEGKVVPLDFTMTAEKVVEAVVNIKSTQTFNRGSNNNMPQTFRRQLPDPFRDFFNNDDMFRPFFRFETPKGK